MPAFLPRRQPSRRGRSFNGFLTLSGIISNYGTLGSLADVPQDLLEQIKELEKIFTVDQKKLKEITDHFVKELTKGKLK